MRLDCLGFLAGSNCPHYDSEPLRRPTFRKLVAAGRMTDGLAADDGAALHYVDGRLLRAVTSRPRARAWRVRRLGHRTVETRIRTVFLGRS
jgi:peptidase E